MTGLEFLGVEATKTLAGLAMKTVWEKANFRLDEPVKQLFYRASGQYIQRYTQRHGSLKVLGMREPVNLDSVYTAVQVLNCDDRSFASAEEMERAFRATRERRLRSGEKSRKEGLAIATEKQYLMVLGAPGCGKSTFLRKMGLEALKGKQGEFKQHPCIPVLLELKRFTKPKIDIKKLIAKEFEICSFPDPDGFTQKALDQGKLLILLDGLDEVPTANRESIIEVIQDFVDQYDKNRYITSCRVAAYRYNFRRFTDVTITEFNELQIEQFVENWFQSEEDFKSGTAERCRELLQQNVAAKELAHTPLLLTFLCLVYDRTQTFSNNRSTLYRKALRILLEEWAAEKRIMHQEIYQGLSTELEEVLLSEIAYKSFVDDRLFLSQIELVEQIKRFLATNLNAPKHLGGEAVLDAIAIQQGILVERAEDIYSFSHLTLQEYLTARYIIDNRKIEQFPEQYLDNDRWREVFLLVSGSLLGGNGADELLQAMSIPIQLYAAKSSKIQILLQWVDKMTAPVTDSQEWVAKRVIMLVFILQFACYLNNHISLERTCAGAGDLANALSSPLANVLSLASTLASIIASTLEPAYNLDWHSSHLLARAFESASLCAGKLALVSNPLSSEVDFLLFTKQLVFFRSTLPKTDASREDRKQFADRLKQLYVNTFKLNSALLKLTSGEEKEIESYLYMNQLMVQCKLEASRVSPQVWDAILSTMFVPASAS